MKSRIEELARECGADIGVVTGSIRFNKEIDLHKFANAILELAARECENKERRKWEILQNSGQIEGIGPLDCAEAIRKIKV